MTIVFNTRKKQLAILVSTICLTMSSAFASNCGGSTNNNLTEVTSDTSATCALANGESIRVDAAVSLYTEASGGNIGISLASGIVAGAITNSGTITKNITGILVNGTLTGGITNTGTINGTTGLGMRIGGTVNGNVTNGGTVSSSGNVAVASDGIINGQFINSGTISAVNQNALNITGGKIAQGIVNTASGRIISSAGGILIYGTEVGGINNAGLIDGGTSDWAILIGLGAITGNFVNSGTIKGIDLSSSEITGDFINTGTLSAPGGTAFLIEASTVTGKIINSGTLSGQTAIDIQYSPTPITIDNSGTLDGAVRLSDSILNLNGTTARITGAVEGIGSVVNVNGNFSSQNTFDVGTFNVARGGIFNAANNVTVANALNNNGTLAAKAATPFTVNGNYTQAANASFRTEVLSATNYGQMTVTGNAVLAADTGIDVRVSSLANLAPNTILAGIIKAGSLQASTFRVTDDSALFKFTGVVNGNNVDLLISQASTVYGSTVDNRNFVGAGAARELDKLVAGSSNGGSGDMGTVVTALGRLTDSKQVSDAVKQTLPLMTGATASAAAAAVNQTGRIVQARQDANLGLSTGEDVISDKQIWAKPFGSWARQGDRNGVSGFDARTGGLVIGADGVLSEHDRLGAAFAYAHTNVSGNDSSTAQSAKIDSYQAMLYGSHSIDERTELSWQGDVGINRTDGERNINFGGLSRRAASSYNGWSAHAGTGLARVFSLNEALSVAPSLRLDYTSLTTRGYTETGAGALNLQVDSQRTEELIVAAESKLSYAVATDTTIVANLGIGYNLLAKSAQITSTFAGGGSAFSTEGLEPSPWSIRGGAGLILHRQGGTEVTARYDAEANRSGFSNQTVSLKVRQSF